MTIRKAIFDAVRPLARPGLFNDPGNVLALDNLLDAFGVPVDGAAVARALSAAPAAGVPVWLVEARRHVGLKEIPGPKHSATILGWVKRLGGWFTDDETPWCGTFVAHCMEAIGQKPPVNWFRARDWSTWGKATPPRVGAVAVFGRDGGGHVGFVVGESASHLYVLGGNQSNMVNIAPIAKTRLLAMRWPAGLPLSDATLPRMTGGAVSRNEA